MARCFLELQEMGLEPRRIRYIGRGRGTNWSNNVAKLRANALKNIECDVAIGDWTIDESEFINKLFDCKRNSVTERGLRWMVESSPFN